MSVKLLLRDARVFAFLRQGVVSIKAYIVNNTMETVVISLVVDCGFRLTFVRRLVKRYLLVLVNKPRSVTDHLDSVSQLTDVV